MLIVRILTIMVLILAVECGLNRVSGAAELLRQATRTISPRAEKATAHIRVGTPDLELDAWLRAVSSDRGTIYWGGSGAKRMYYQIAPTKQIWFEIGGSYDGKNFGKVVHVGPIEPKERWTRHRGDSITVESIFNHLPGGGE